MYLSVLPAYYVYVCTTYMPSTHRATEAKRGCWIHCTWNYRKLWVVMWAPGPNPRSFASVPSAANHGAIFLPPNKFSIELLYCENLPVIFTFLEVPNLNNQILSSKKTLEMCSGRAFPAEWVRFGINWNVCPDYIVIVFRVLSLRLHIDH